MNEPANQAGEAVIPAEAGGGSSGEGGPIAGGAAQTDPNAAAEAESGEGGAGAVAQTGAGGGESEEENTAGGALGAAVGGASSQEEVAGGGAAVNPAVAPTEAPAVDGGAPVVADYSSSLFQAFSSSVDYTTVVATDGTPKPSPGPLEEQEENIGFVEEENVGFAAPQEGDADTGEPQGMSAATKAGIGSRSWSWCLRCCGCGCRSSILCKTSSSSIGSSFGINKNFLSFFIQTE